MDLSKAQKARIGNLSKEELQEELSEEGRPRFGQDSRWYIQKRLDEFLEVEEKAEKEREQAMREKEISIAENALAVGQEARESSHKAGSQADEASTISRGADLKSWIAIGISLLALFIAVIGMSVN